MKILLPNEYKENFIMLYKMYGNKELDIQEVSDHWIQFGSKTKMVISNDEKYIHINPVGFDDYKKSNILNNFLNIPVKIYLKKYRKQLNKKIYEKLLNAINLQGRVLSFNCFKQALSLNKILENDVDLNSSKIAIIGDGNGFLGILLKLLFPKIKIVQINLGKILLFDYLFSANSMIFDKLNIVLKKNDYINDSDCYFVPSNLVADISPKDIDIFFNIASMQEMKPVIIKKYFDLMRSQNTRKTFFYCCNRINKILSDGSNSSFDNYNWIENDKIIFDENCFWYNQAPMSRPPFIKKFDGPHKHKYVELGKY